MKFGYLEASDPGATSGMEKRPKIEQKGCHEGVELEECPVCFGYGGWHLKLDAYGEGKHFDCSCSNCNGWGYLEKGKEGYNARYARLKAKFEKVLKNSPAGQGYSHKRSVVILTDKSLVNDPELKEALILCADGWWAHNFGGQVERTNQDNPEGIVYNVKVYTD